MMEWITAIASFLAIIISFLSVFHNKRLLMTDNITKQRINWISNVRFATAEFAMAYLRENDICEILEKKYLVDLYLNPKNEEHLGLIEAMNKSLEIDFNIDNKVAYLDKIINEAQILLNKSWRRMKIESDMSKGFEIKRDSKL